MIPSSPIRHLFKMFAATPQSLRAPFPSVGRRLFHASYGFISHLPSLQRPLLIFPLECKVQRGWEFITLIRLVIFPIEFKVQHWWEFITLIPLLIFPIKCKVQRGSEFITLIPLLIFPIECKVQRLNVKLNKGGNL